VTPPSLTIAPNPLHLGTTVDYALPERSLVRLSIYDAAGRLVRTLESGEQDAGQRQVSWDARSNLGTRVAAGVYLIRLEVGPATRIGKVVVVP